MKNLIVYGPTQSGIQKVSSVLKQHFNLNSQKLVLGNFFNVFGDRLVQPTSNIGHPFAKAYPKATLNSYVTKFTKKDGVIKAFNDYNIDQINKPEAEIIERANLLVDESGYFLTISSWDDLHDKSGSISKEMELAELIFVRPDNALELLLSYGLAHNTYVWVIPTSAAPIDVQDKFVLERKTFENLSKEVEVFKARLDSLPGAKVITQSELQDTSKAMKKLGLNHDLDPKESFEEPVFLKEKLSYFQNKEEIKKWALELQELLS